MTLIIAPSQLRCAPPESSATIPGATGWPVPGKSRDLPDFRRARAGRSTIAVTQRHPRARLTLKANHHVLQLVNLGKSLTNRQQLMSGRHCNEE